MVHFSQLQVQIHTDKQGYTVKSQWGMNVLLLDLAVK